MLFISKGIPEKDGISVELRIVVGGSAAGAVTVEDFLLGNVTLLWS